MNPRRQPHEDTLRLLRLIWREGDVREVRIPAHRKFGGVAAGWFDSPSKLAQAITEWDGFGNIFFTLNPVNPDLIARSNNRITRQRETTPDGEVTRRSLLLIDIDPDRPSGISSTDAELAEARRVLDAALAFLTDSGWPEPLVAMSGNGFYLLYGLDLPNDAESTRLIKGALEELNRRFKSEAAHIDTSVYNAARIAGLIGTMKVKGDQTAERRHRRSEIISSPEHLKPVSREQLLALGGGTGRKPAGEPPAASRASRGGRLLADLLSEAGIEYREQPPDAAGVTWYHVRRCPFHGDGRDFECGVGQNLSSGAFAGHCFHPEGAGKGWQEWKTALGLRTGFAALISTPPQVRRRLTDFPRTDSGNAELFAQLYGGRLRYDHRRGRWLLWRETRWAEDKDGEVHRLAKEAVRQRFLAASGLEDPEEKQAQAKFAIQSENRQRLDAMLNLAKNEPAIADAGDAWDLDPWLLGVENGVVDLRTGQLLDAEPAQGISNSIPVRYDPDAECPRWLQFLAEIFEGDEELIDFIWKAVGYSLSGDTSEQCLFICHGSGSNGKSVFLGTIRALAGDYAFNAPFSTFELQNRTTIPNDVAPLASKRLVTASETNDGTRLNEARLKALTGGDPISARFLHREYFSFIPEAKYWLAVNYRPRVDDLSYGFWRRVRLVPFTRTFIGNQDKHLAAKLVRELPGILAWAVRGCLAWQSEGLGAPASVRAATEQYRNESDPLSQFIDDCCVVNPNTQCGATEIYLAYQRWASQQGMSERERLSATSFGTKMGARFAKKRSGKGNVYVGLGLRSDREQDGHDPTRVQGSVQGSESSAGLIEVSPPEKSLTRENPEVPYTTLHPTQAVACHCGDEIDSFAADGSPRCWKHREVEARL